MGFPRKRRSTRCMNYNGMFMVLCFCSRTTDALRSGFLLIPACFVCGFLSKYLFRQIYLHFSSCCLSISSPDVLAQKFAWLHGSKTIGLLLIPACFVCGLPVHRNTSLCTCTEVCMASWFQNHRKKWISAATPGSAFHLRLVSCRLFP
ncbi:unnamed protein product [Musa acuminata subsp. burmannicoides]